NRRDFAAIVSRYLDLAPDVLMGGGKEQFLAKRQNGSFGDEADALSAFLKKNYHLVENKTELERADSGKLLGLFAAKEMSFEIDRDKNREPSVYAMTRAAINELH